MLVRWGCAAGEGACLMDNTAEGNDGMTGRRNTK